MNGVVLYTLAGIEVLRLAYASARLAARFYFSRHSETGW